MRLRRAVAFTCVLLVLLLQAWPSYAAEEQRGSASAAASSGVGAAASVGAHSIEPGVISIVADKTEYDREKRTFLCSGDAIAYVGGQNSKLEADTIGFDRDNAMFDARGNVRITRNGQLTTGSSYRFKASSDEYLITSPDPCLKRIEVVPRTANGACLGVIIKNREIGFSLPVQIEGNAIVCPLEINAGSGCGQVSWNEISRLKAEGLEGSAWRLFSVGCSARKFRPLTEINIGNSTLLGAFWLQRKLYLERDTVPLIGMSKSVLNSWVLSSFLSPSHPIVGLVRNHGLPVVGPMDQKKRLPACDFPLPHLWDEPYKKEWPPYLEAGESKYDLKNTVKKDNP